MRRTRVAKFSQKPREETKQRKREGEERRGEKERERENAKEMALSKDRGR